MLISLRADGVAGCVRFPVLADTLARRSYLATCSLRGASGPDDCFREILEMVLAVQQLFTRYELSLPEFDTMTPAFTTLLQPANVTPGWRRRRG